MKTLRAVFAQSGAWFHYSRPVAWCIQHRHLSRRTRSGAGNMGDFTSTPPSSTVIFDSVKAPGEFEIWVSIHTFTPAHFKKKMTIGPYLRTRAAVLKWIQVVISAGWSINMWKHQAIISTAVPITLLHMSRRHSSLPASRWPILELMVHRTLFQARQMGTRIARSCHAGASVLEDVSTCLCYISRLSLVTTDNEIFSSRLCTNMLWPRPRNHLTRSSLVPSKRTRGPTTKQCHVTCRNCHFGVASDSIYVCIVHRASEK